MEHIKIKIKTKRSSLFCRNTNSTATKPQNKIILDPTYVIHLQYHTASANLRKKIENYSWGHLSYFFQKNNILFIHFKLNYSYF